MTCTSAVSRRCIVLLASNCNNDQQLRYTNLFLPWYKSSQQKQKVVNFSKSKTTTKKDSTKSTNLRRVKKDPRIDILSNQSSSTPVTTESDVIPASSTASNVKKILSLPVSKPEVQFTSVYVHPISKIVLNHFQTHCHEWIQSKQLDNTLILHLDGTFALGSSPRPPTSRPTASSATASILRRENDWLTLPYSNEGAAVSIDVRIWTTFDAVEGRHWLCVSIDDNVFQTKYLLQDNSLTPWQSGKLRSIPERIQASVYELMDAVNTYENYRKQ